MHFEYQVSLDQTKIYGLGYGRAGRYAILHANFSVEFKSLSLEMPKIYEVSLKSQWESEEDLVRNLEKLHAPFQAITKDKSTDQRKRNDHLFPRRSEDGIDPDVFGIQSCFHEQRDKNKGGLS